MDLVRHKVTCDYGGMNLIAQASLSCPMCVPMYFWRGRAVILHLKAGLGSELSKSFPSIKEIALSFILSYSSKAASEESRCCALDYDLLSDLTLM